MHSSWVVLILASWQNWWERDDDLREKTEWLTHSHCCTQLGSWSPHLLPHSYGFRSKSKKVHKSNVSVSVQVWVVSLASIYRRTKIWSPYCGQRRVDQKLPPLPPLSGCVAWTMISALVLPFSCLTTLSGHRRFNPTWSGLGNTRPGYISVISRSPLHHFWQSLLFWSETRRSLMWPSVLWSQKALMLICRNGWETFETSAQDMNL